LTSANLDAGLKGNTLRVYTYIFKVQRSGIRDVQHNLGLKSASLAQYHLDRLVELGLASKDDQTGEYVLAKEIKVEALEQFLKVGSHIIPRFLLYSVVLTVLFVYFAYLTAVVARSIDAWAFVFAIFGVSVLWLETARAWRNSP